MGSAYHNASSARTYEATLASGSKMDCGGPWGTGRGRNTGGDARDQAALHQHKAVDVNAWVRAEGRGGAGDGAGCSTHGSCQARDGTADGAWGEPVAGGAVKGREKDVAQSEGGAGNRQGNAPPQQGRAWDWTWHRAGGGDEGNDSVPPALAFFCDICDMDWGSRYPCRSACPYPPPGSGLTSVAGLGPGWPPVP